jgi:hypothetical protein
VGYDLSSLRDWRQRQLETAFAGDGGLESPSAGATYSDGSKRSTVI